MKKVLCGSWYFRLFQLLDFGSCTCTGVVVEEVKVVTSVIVVVERFWFLVLFTHRRTEKRVWREKERVTSNQRYKRQRWSELFFFF